MLASGGPALNKTPEEGGIKALPIPKLLLCLEALHRVGFDSLLCPFCEVESEVVISALT